MEGSVHTLFQDPGHFVMCEETTNFLDQDNWEVINKEQVET
jgi:hypothetical protein